MNRMIGVFELTLSFIILEFQTSLEFRLVPEDKTYSVIVFTLVLKLYQYLINNELETLLL